MRRLILVVIACAGAACTDTLVGPFIEPTYEVSKPDDLSTLGLSFEPGNTQNPEAVCAKPYDREFAPLGEHYRTENWRPLSRAFSHDSDLEAIIDGNTFGNDFGQVALVWRADGRRLKLFAPELATIPQLPSGCYGFAELRIDRTSDRGRMRQVEAPYALTN